MLQAAIEQEVADFVGIGAMTRGGDTSFATAIFPQESC
jgi:hypothetical protein